MMLAICLGGIDLLRKYHFCGLVRTSLVRVAAYIQTTQAILSLCFAGKNPICGFIRKTHLQYIRLVVGSSAMHWLNPPQSIYIYNIHIINCCQQKLHGGPPPCPPQ